MADIEKRFAPTETKLRRLRAEGIFPRTAIVLALGAAAGGSIAFAAAVARHAQSVRGFFSESLAGRLPRPAGGAIRFVDLFASSALLIAGVVAAVVLLTGLLQNRFYFSFGSVFRPGPRSSPGAGARLWAFAGGAACAGLLLFVAWWFLVDAARYYRETFLPLVLERKFHGATPMTLAEVKSNFENTLRLLLAVEIELFRARLGLLAETLIGVLLFAGIIARVLAGVEFQRQHGMSREELEAELLEGEVSPQLRDAQRSRSLENLPSDKLREDSEPDNS